MRFSWICDICIGSTLLTFHKTSFTYITDLCEPSPPEKKIDKTVKSLYWRGAVSPNQQNEWPLIKNCYYFIFILTLPTSICCSGYELSWRHIEHFIANKWLSYTMSNISIAYVPCHKTHQCCFPTHVDQHQNSPDV